ncbi:hypothetical protein G6F46_001708 [Rhizopus delemar]|uniref:NAD(P)-binding protein n=2 Tax=Rhizopus TaxID=4842 RepID=A0A9P7CUG3_9FUNG|nr:hypothetical protein G6F55_000901 [Rhizopus delemar]KAG1553560.1 hypothetical protein G6F51_000524 [Rhizopus arrhizus]KAG1504156.1 hypothetical protein G6F54_001190 [Rhizopus delemar]KAG1517469.1 hypothetical protein G6F53_001351 [Rhizopus delemar]KAG1561516.1 hypothetical protein G6F49_001737 [Rhizopus delemar]
MIILITGSTNGLGRLTAKKLIEQGHTVIITGRSQISLDEARKWIVKDLEKHNENLYELVMDLSDLKTIQTAIKTLESFKLDCIDVVVHNAGCVNSEFKQIGDIEATVFINAVAPLYLNRLLLPFVEKSKHVEKKILFVTSSLHDPNIAGGGRSENARIPRNIQVKEDLQGSQEKWEPMKYYRISKLASIWDAYSLASTQTIPVVAFCPGFVPTTDLNRNSGLFLRLVMRYILPWFSFVTSEQDATDDYIFYITSRDLENGKYYRKREHCPSSKDSLDVSKQETYIAFANQQINQLI